MSVALYMDVHVNAAITRGLLLKGVDVMTAQADESAELPDEELLKRCNQFNRVLFTQDEDFLAIGPDWQRRGKYFTGIFFADQLGITIGRAISDLEIIGLAGNPEDCANRVQYLPL